MATSTKTFQFGIVDAKIAVLTDDPEGGSPTYDTSVDVPGITKLTLKVTVESKKLRGDNRQLVTRSYITGVEAEVEHAKLSLDVLAAALGGTAATTGTTPDEVASWSLTATSSPVPFRLEAITAAADPIQGNQTIRLHNAIVTALEGIGGQDEEFTEPKMTLAADPLLSTGDWLDIDVNETAAALS